MVKEPGKSDRSKYPGSLRREPEAGESVMDFATFYEQVYVKWRYADRHDAQGSDPGAPGRMPGQQNRSIRLRAA